MAALDSSTKIGGVAIGRNEGERLRACINSLVRDFQVVVYVDSGSTDDSVAIARGLGVDTVELDTSVGFTASRARNTGLRRLLELAPDIELVQFVDGDCEVVEGWLAAAAKFLREHPDVAVACGRRSERYPLRNWYHRVTDMEWDTPIGEARYCGGDALMRESALRQVNGYRETLIAGEEPELCVRLRRAGWKVWRLDHDMTRHDIRMSRFAQWWKRTVRSGYAYAEGVRLHGSSPERHCVKETRSIWFWGVLIPLTGIGLAWPTSGLSLLVMAAMYAWLYVKITRYRTQRRGDSLSDASLYALFCIVSKWPQAVGVLKSKAHWLAGSDASVIEYHDSKLSTIHQRSADCSARP